jgi:ribonuclease D
MEWKPEHDQVIDNEQRLKDFLPRVRPADWIAMDTEADSLHAYPEKLCLIQMSLPGLDELVDPLADIDVPLLLHELKAKEIILHGADYDLRLLHRTYGFAPSSVFDTMLAARFLGLHEFGLHHLAEKFLGERLEKGSQKANWAKRPLTPRLETYALSDARVLKPLADLLRQQLRDRGQEAWHQETCARLIRDCGETRRRDPELVWRIAGSDRLSRRGLAIVRELWHWREDEALKSGKPPYFVLSHEKLIELASAPPEARLHSILPHHFSSRRVASITAAIERGLEIPPGDQPRHVRRESHRWTAAEKQRCEVLRKRRDQAATELGLDPSFIASRATLLALARNGEHHDSGLLNWQRRLLGLD